MHPGLCKWGLPILHQKTDTAIPNPGSKARLQDRQAILEFLECVQPAHLPEAPAEGLALAFHALGEKVLHIGGHILPPVVSRHRHLASILHEVHHHVGLPKIRLLFYLGSQKETS